MHPSLKLIFPSRLLLLKSQSRQSCDPNVDRKDSIEKKGQIGGRNIIKQTEAVNAIVRSVHHPSNEISFSNSFSSHSFFPNVASSSFPVSQPSQLASFWLSLNISWLQLVLNVGPSRLSVYPRCLSIHSVRLSVRLSVGRLCAVCTARRLPRSSPRSLPRLVRIPQLH